MCMPCLSRLCLSKPCFVPKSLPPQISHVNPTPCDLIMCLLWELKFFNTFPHNWQGWVFTSAWVLRCSLSWYRRRNPFPQISQTSFFGRFSCCLFLCACTLLKLVALNSQISHWNGFSPVWLLQNNFCIIYQILRMSQIISYSLITEHKY